MDGEKLHFLCRKRHFGLHHPGQLCSEGGDGEVEVILETGNLMCSTGGDGEDEVILATGKLDEGITQIDSRV